jgi:RimJ/RimL family protein N-acetyltransferase
MMVVVDTKYITKTERLLLRPLKLDDAEDVVLMRKNAEVMKHTYVLVSLDCPALTIHQASFALR